MQTTIFVVNADPLPDCGERKLWSSVIEVALLDVRKGGDDKRRSGASIDSVGMMIPPAHFAGFAKVSD
jgi:hypothetical protein